jgi:hypothetical protein
MPIDPSIIGNVMAPQAPQLPDVNAMLETQTRGAENIFKIETARQQEAKLAQQEAAQAREAATIKALLPAYTYGIQTGDIAGALDLVPPEMQESLRPYVDALAGKPPEEVKAALIGSMSTSDMGREALAAIQRAGTLGVQQGQLTLAQQQAEREAAAAGQPKPMTEYEAERIRLDREKAAREAAKDAAIASGEAPPVDLQKGERWNPETGRVEAVPGSTTYNKQKSTQAKDYNAATNALRELNKVRGVVSELKNTTGYQKAMGTGAIMSNLPNTPASSITGAYDFQTKYKNLKGSVATLGRAAASLQGKLGNMAVQEWKLVSDAIANLDLASMDADVLDAQLDIIANDIIALEAQVRDAYEKEWGDTQFYNPLDSRGPAGGGDEGAGDDPLGIR